MASKKIPPGIRPVRFFHLYAPKDESLYKEFEKHLSLLIRQRLVSLTSVEDISPGMERSAAIKQAIQEAQIILCFLSANFLASPDYTFIESILEEQAEIRSRIVPILLRKVYIEGLPLNEIQSLPKNARPVTLWADKDQAFEHIAQELSSMVEQMNRSANPVMTGDHLQYLHWLIQRLSYPSAQGTHPPQPSSQIKLEDVLIPLLAQRVEEVSAPSTQGEEETHKASPLPVSEVILRHSHLLLLGEPGSGKTMCLHGLALRQAEQMHQKVDTDNPEIRLPILLRLADYVEYGRRQGKSLNAYLAEDNIRHGCGVSQLTDVLQTALQAGKCLVLLDGLDEVAGTDERLAVLQDIEEFVAQYKGVPNRFIITSRLMIDGTALFRELFVYYRLCKLDAEGIWKFLQAWYPVLQATSPTKQREAIQDRPTVEAIYRTIQANPALLQFAANPLLLHMLMQLYQADESLPRQRIALYTQLTRVLLQTERLSPEASERTSIGVLWQLSQPSIASLLRRLGFWLQSNRPGGMMSEDEIFGQWRTIWPALIHQQPRDEDPLLEQKMGDLLHTITSHTGIMVEETPGYYRFAHLTFEEYFAACHLVAEAAERGTFIRNHLLEAHWQEPILFALGLIGMETPEETHLLVQSMLLAEGEKAKARGVASSPYEDLLGRDFLFVLRCLENDIPVQPAFAERLIKRLYQELAYNVGSGRFSLYQDALSERLRGLEVSSYAPVLLSHYLSSLEHPDDPTRLWAVYRLIGIGRASLPARERVCQQLRAMLSDEKPFIRSTCLQGLHDLDAPGLREILPDLLQNEVDGSVQEKALSYLSEIGTRSAQLTEVLLYLLKQTISDSGNYRVRQSAVAALGECGVPSPAVIAALSSLLSPNIIDTHVLASLRQLSHQSSEVVPMLLNALQAAPQEPHPAVLAEIATFGHMTSQVKEAFLLYMLRTQNHVLRTYATQELQQLEEISEQAEETLQTYLSDKESNVRRLAVEVLCAFELSAKTFSMLCAILSTDSDVSLRTHIIECLVYTEWPDKDLLPALLQAMHDPNEQIRSCAIRNLGKRAPTSPQILAEFLSILSHDPSRYVRCSVVRYLQELSSLPQKALPVLVQALADKDPFIRRNCAQLVGQHGTGNKQTTQALTKGLSDNDGLVRQACSQALVLLGQRSSQCKPTIMKQLEQYLRKRQDAPIGCLDSADLAFRALWHLTTYSFPAEES